MILSGLGLGLGATPAALAAGTATARVPCSAAALASAMSDATGGQTLALAPYCVYGLPAALPVVTGRLSLLGNHATLRPSSAAGPRHFAILTVGTESTAGILTISNLNVSDGDPGIALDDGSATVSGGTFTGNSPAIASFYDGTRLTVSGAAFTGNTGTFGGAIETGYAAQVSDSTFTGNRARVGGGIAAENGRLAVSRCRFVDNRATASGGALSDGGTATVTGSSFAGDRRHLRRGHQQLQPGHRLPDHRRLRVHRQRRPGRGGTLQLQRRHADRELVHREPGGPGRRDRQRRFRGWFRRRVHRESGPPGRRGLLHHRGHFPQRLRPAAEPGGPLRRRRLRRVAVLHQHRAALVHRDDHRRQRSREQAGGGIYDAAATRDTVTLTDTVMAGNLPDNCAPAGSVAACAGPAGPPAGPARRYTPRSAIRRPEAMAAVKAWKSRSFWSAYAAAKSPIAFSNTSEAPR